MPSTKPSAKPAATIVNATAKTRSVIEDLGARLTGTRTPPVDPHQETIEDLERQLQEYFNRAVSSNRPGVLDDLRNRVIDGVVDRILADWSHSGAAPGIGLGREVMDRLIERVLDDFRKHVVQDGHPARG